MIMTAKRMTIFLGYYRNADIQSIYRRVHTQQQIENWQDAVQIHLIHRETAQTMQPRQMVRTVLQTVQTMLHRRQIRMKQTHLPVKETYL